MASQLPSGTVTFLFTDIEGSTKLWQQHPAQMPNALAQHHTLLRAAIEANAGYVFQIIGDAFCAAFSTTTDGLDAALAAQRGLRDATWGETGTIRVRMALHTGAAELRAGEFTSGEYVSGLTLSRAARLLSAGHGGQILLSLPSSELVRDHLPKDVTLRDMGARRLKDLIRPEQIFQVVTPDLPAEFAPLKTLDIHPHNLPVQLTSFIGREREMEAVKKLLTTTHLLTLTGAGGTGKTRLSLQVSADLIDEFIDGVWFVELAPLTDPTLIPNTLAKLWNVNEQPNRAMIETLSDYVRAKNLLLILDNCEQLIAGCAQVAEALLRVASKLKILATSREAVGIAGETVYRVPSLSLPPIQLPTSNFQTLTQYEAVRLFIERALAVKNDFAVTNANAPAVAQICHRLDGIPLAIELAAARAKAMSPEQIATRLDDRFHLLTGGSRMALPRHQTLRATVDWSWGLLAEDERALLRRLSVFAGGWTLQTAEAIGVGEEIQSSDVLDLLTQLVSKSLVIWQEEQDEPRYHLLEMIREYAREKLVDAGEEATVRQHHAEFFAQWAEYAASQMYTPMQTTWVKRFDLERDNLRAALGWAVNEQPVVAFRIANALADTFWYLRGAYTEGVQWYERALSSAPDAPIELRAYALAYTAHFASQLGQKTQYAEQSLELARQKNDKILLAFALGILGAIKLDYGDQQGATACFEEALPLAQATQSPYVPVILVYMGWVRVGVGEYNQAESYFQQAAEAYRAASLMSGLTECLWNLGDLAFLRGDIAKARADLTEGLGLAREFQTKTWIGHISETLARVRILDGALDEARTLLSQSLVMHQDLGRKPCVAHNLEGWARLAMAQGNPQRAARILSALTAHLNRLGIKLIPLQQMLYDQTLPIVKQKLDQATFNAAWAEGQKMTLEQTIELASNDVAPV